MRQAAKRGMLTAMATGSVLASTAGYALASTGAEGAAVGSPGVASGNVIQVPIEVPLNVCGNTINLVGILNPAIGNKCANVERHTTSITSVRHGAAFGHGGYGHGVEGFGRRSGVLDARSGGLHGGFRHHDRGGTQAKAAAVGSPGVLSGNVAQAPIHIPINACGNSANVIFGALNPAIGNSCANVEEHRVHIRKIHIKRAFFPPVVHRFHKVHHKGFCVEARCAEHAPGFAVRPPARVAVPRVPAAVKGVARRPAVAAKGKEALAVTGAGEVGLAGSLGALMLLGGTVLYRRSRAGSR